MAPWRVIHLTAILCGLSPAAPAAPRETYEDGDSVYAALRAHPPSDHLVVGGGQIDVLFADDAPGLDRAPVLAWIGVSAGAVSTYFGRFPVARVAIVVVADNGPLIHGGTTWGFDGSVIRIHVGRAARADTFRQDWILTHEMSHLALPTTPRANLWLEEGEAVYVEPIARTQADGLDVREVWRWALTGMAKGEPGPGDGGLDNNRSWGRTYWGGAGFWLQSDVAIRRRTHNRIGVQTALRAINRASGGNGARWSIEHVLAVGDAATGGHELTTLYGRTGAAPAPFDYEKLFVRLGVSLKDGQVIFNDRAPWADIRDAITSGRRGHAGALHP